MSVVEIINTHFIQAAAVLFFMILSWLLGVRFIAKRAGGTRERRFVFRAGIFVLLGTLAFSVLDYFVLKSSGAGVGIILFSILVISRRRQLQIRREEANA